jgi:hypothetical protein
MHFTDILDLYRVAQARKGVAPTRIEMSDARRREFFESYAYMNLSAEQFARLTEERIERDYRKVRTIRFMNAEIVAAVVPEKEVRIIVGGESHAATFRV